MTTAYHIKGLDCASCAAKIEDAIETADVVLITDSPLKMVEAVQTARRTRTIVWQNIVMALSIKIVFVVLGTGTMGIASMWEAVFADMGVAIAAIVNSTRGLIR